MISSRADFFFFSRASELEDGSFLLVEDEAAAFRALAPSTELQDDRTLETKSSNNKD